MHARKDGQEKKQGRKDLKGKITKKTTLCIHVKAASVNSQGSNQRVSLCERRITLQR